MTVRRCLTLFASLATLASLALVTTPSVRAATEFENGLVPLELLRQITGGSVYRSLPDGFPVVTLPAGYDDVRLLGSVQRGGNRDAVLSTQDPEALRATLTAAYVAAGWVDVSGAAASTMSRLCHDEFGLLSIVRPSSAFSGLRITHSASFVTSGQTCASLTQDSFTQWATYFLELMPTLTPPPQTLPPGNIPFFGTSLSSRSANGSGTVHLERAYDISVPDINIAGLYAHFAARMNEQGWVNDSEDSGIKSAVSVWYKTAAPPANVEASDTQLTGYLTLLHSGGENFRVTLELDAVSDAEALLGSPFTISYGVFGNFDGPPVNTPQLGIRGIPAGWMPQ